MMIVTVTVRIPKSSRRRGGMEYISHALRRKMEEVEVAKRVGELFSRISEEEIVNWIKEARKER
jgi:hypothetical protein